MWVDQQEKVQSAHFAMGTVMTHNLIGSQAEECMEAIEREIGFLERKMSRFIQTSDISLLNQKAGVSATRVCADTFEALARAKAFSQRLNGVFDVTIAPLVYLWNIGKEAFARPAAQDIERALSLVNHSDLWLESETMSAGLRHSGQAVDLGGIGKGLAATRIAELFRQFGITSAFSNLGGHVIAEGRKPDGSPWRVGIQNPRNEKELIGVVSVCNASVVTSGDYQRFSRDAAGNRFHHILDARTGYPCRSEFSGVTVVSADSVAADVLSTAIFILGRKEGLALLKSFPGTEAILIDRQGRVFVADGLEDRFQPAPSTVFEFVKI